MEYYFPGLPLFLLQRELHIEKSKSYSVFQLKKLGLTTSS
jgi:hypothetical protein